MLMHFERLFPVVGADIDQTHNIAPAGWVRGGEAVFVREDITEWLPNFLEIQVKFASFRRKLYRW